MKIVYLKVKVVLEDDVDVADFVSEVDYKFNGKGIVSTEIMDCEQK